MVNQSCPMKYSCRLLVERLQCDWCGWSEFDFSKINLSEIEAKIIENRNKEKEKEV